MAKDLEGKVFLVTGATEGIGKAAALEFAQRGADLTVVGRNREKTERVLSELRAAASGSPVEMLLGDMSVMAEVRRVAGEFKAKKDRLDVLVNNAGAIFAKKQVSSDGLEMTFALNHLGYFLLTNELFELLEKSPGSRVVSTSSGAHFMGKLDLTDVARCEKGYSTWRAYGDSKLANVLFTRELARRLGEGHAANCIHPGWVHTGFAMNNKGIMANIVGATASLFARTPKKGAETIVWLATAPDASGVNGQYLHDLKVYPTSKRAQDDALAKDLWALSEKLVAAPG
ncbi:MAG TPA: SDR family oxidoreductase [Myxococcales bacterium]|jgi:NAD(P)-dependent dehydrogenase (short-subunit alcohol dehydrogenase family)